MFFEHLSFLTAFIHIAVIDAVFGDCTSIMCQVPLTWLFSLLTNTDKLLYIKLHRIQVQCVLLCVVVVS